MLVRISLLCSSTAPGPENHEADFKTLISMVFSLIFCYFSILRCMEKCHLSFLFTLGIWLVQRNAKISVSANC